VLKAPIGAVLARSPPSGLNYTAWHYVVNCRLHGKIVIQTPRSVQTVPCIQRYHFTGPVLALAEGLQRRALPGEIRVQAAVAAALADRFSFAGAGLSGSDMPVGEGGESADKLGVSEEELLLVRKLPEEWAAGC
jgi:acyl CoA:acetate/3-ketoacid CoA transferase alpha subunit